MDLRFGEDYERFRRELRDFLADWPLKDEEAALPAAQQEALFRRRTVERGYGLPRDLRRPYPPAARVRWMSSVAPTSDPTYGIATPPFGRNTCPVTKREASLAR